jgi:ribosomal protein S18 acetylase RimI-like enzyme
MSTSALPGEITIRPLTGIPFEELYDAHLSAFKDYPFQWTSDSLWRTIKRRRFSPELSFGAFHKQKLVSFTWNGIGAFAGQRTAYDTGTGTAEAYRGKGLASRIFEYSIPHLKAAGITQYVLEVLTGNAPALSVYTKQGFSISRTFHCFRTNMDSWEFRERPLPSGLVFRKLRINEALVGDMHDFLSSWQNNFESLQVNPSHFDVLGVYRDKELLGYGIIEPETGDIPQLAVKVGERRKGIGSAILGALRKKNKAEIVKVINVPSDRPEIIAFLLHCCIPEVVMQYEMIRKL